MYSRQTEIINKTGLHVRPASEFVSAASKFESKITITKLDENGSTVKNGMAKSVVSLMTMELSQGTKIKLSAEGSDEQAAVDKLVELIKSGFGE